METDARAKANKKTTLRATKQMSKLQNYEENAGKAQVATPSETKADQTLALDSSCAPASPNIAI